MSNRNERRRARGEGHLDNEMFAKIADKFIDVANRENKTFLATDLHLAFLYGSSRYSAHVAKNIAEVDNQEEWVKSMTQNYQEMLRNHLADPNL